MSMTSSIEILIGGHDEGHDEKSIDLINERLIYLITPTWRKEKVEFKDTSCFYIAIMLNSQYYPVQKHLSHI